MTELLLTHGDAARARLNHPMRSLLRRAISEHAGPWDEVDVARLNELEVGGLRFEAKNGQLHVYSSAGRPKGHHEAQPGGYGVTRLTGPLLLGAINSQERSPGLTSAAQRL